MFYLCSIAVLCSSCSDLCLCKPALKPCFIYVIDHDSISVATTYRYIKSKVHDSKIYSLLCHLVGLDWSCICNGTQRQQKARLFCGNVVKYAAYASSSYDRTSKRQWRHVDAKTTQWAFDTNDVRLNDVQTFVNGNSRPLFSLLSSFYYS